MSQYPVITGTIYTDGSKSGTNASGDASSPLQENFIQGGYVRRPYPLMQSMSQRVSGIRGLTNSSEISAAGGSTQTLCPSLIPLKYSRRAGWGVLCKPQGQVSNLFIKNGVGGGGWTSGMDSFIAPGEDTTRQDGGVDPSNGFRFRENYGYKSPVENSADFINS
jgi:hypothetical protein